MVELAIASQGDGAAKRVRLEAHIGVGKEQPIAGGGFVGFLESMRLAEPAFGKFSDVDDAETVVSGREVVEDAGGGIAGARPPARPTGQSLSSTPHRAPT